MAARMRRMRGYRRWRFTRWLRGFFLGMLLTALTVLALLWFLPGRLQAWLDSAQALLGKG